MLSSTGSAQCRGSDSRESPSLRCSSLWWSALQGTNVGCGLLGGAIRRTGSEIENPNDVNFDGMGGTSLGELEADDLVNVPQQAQGWTERQRLAQLDAAGRRCLRILERIW